jgi:hypothetical protein
MIVVLARYSTALTCVCVVVSPHLLVLSVDITFQISPDRCHWKKDVTRGDRRGLNTYVTTTITVHTRATTGNF